MAGPMLVLSILIPGAFGGGDIKFMAVSGFLLGKEKIICSMACAVMLAGGYCLIMLKCGKLTRKDEFAFGPVFGAGNYDDLICRRSADLMVLAGNLMRRFKNV